MVNFLAVYTLQARYRKNNGMSHQLWIVLRLFLYGWSISSLCLTPVMSQTNDHTNNQNTSKTHKERPLDASNASPSREHNHMYTLPHALQDVITQHPLLQSKAFEIQAQNYALQAAQQLLSPQLTAKIDQNNDLVTIADPIVMGNAREIETEQQKIELGIMQPLRWGTQLNFNLSQNLTQTNNPFRNCVPGISSEQCYESRVSLSLTQPLIRGIGSEINLAEERWNEVAKDLVWYQSKTQINQLILESVRAYVNLSLLKAQKKLEDNELSVVNQQMKDTKNRIDLGVLPASELYTIQLAHAQRMQSLVNIERNVKQASTTLMGLTQSSNHGALALPQLPKFEHSVEDQQSEPNWSKLPSLLSIKARIIQAQIRTLQAHNQQKPQLDIGVVWSQSGLGESIQEALDTLPQNKSYFYGVNLTFSHMLSGRNAALTQQNKSQTKSLHAEFKKELQGVKLEWTQVIDHHSAIKRQLKWAKKAVINAQKSWHAAHSKAQAGRGTQFEVLQIQTQMIQAKFNVLSLTHDLFLNRIQKLSIEDQLLSTFGIEINKQALQRLRHSLIESIP
jgi:outer membrane protein